MSEAESRLRESVYVATAAALEEMAFMEVIRCDGEGAGCSDYRWAAIDVLAPIAARVAIESPLALACRIVGNIFGENQSDAADVERRIDDALAEIVNTIAGRTMREIAGPDASFRLGIPFGGQGKFEDGAGKTARFFFTVEDLPLGVVFCGELP